MVSLKLPDLWIPGGLHIFLIKPLNKSQPDLRIYKDALTETIYDLRERYTPFFVPSRRLKKRVAQRPYAHRRPYKQAAETRRRVEQCGRLYDNLEDEY